MDIVILAATLGLSVLLCLTISWAVLDLVLIVVLRDRTGVTPRPHR
jgi:hypothetical protein